MPKKRICCRIDENIASNVQEIVDSTNLTISNIVQDALQDYIGNYYNKDTSLKSIIQQLAILHDKLYPDNRIMRRK